MYSTTAMMGISLGASGTGPFQGAGVTAARLSNWLVARKSSAVVVLGKSWKERRANDQELLPQQHKI